jgi:Mg/Co/Ni transporter MgtE
VQATDRPDDVRDQIASRDATHCAVIDHSKRFVGIVRLREIAGKSPHRIFADLITYPTPLDVHESLDANLVVKLMEARGSLEIAVLTRSGKYVGLITRESLLEWVVQNFKSGSIRHKKRGEE